MARTGIPVPSRGTSGGFRMPKMGHEEPKKSPAELFNPANWGLVGWAWIMLFVVAGTGIFVVVYQSSVAPQPASYGDRRVRRRGSPPPPGTDGRGAAEGEYQPHPEAYEDQGRGRGGGRGSPGNGNQARGGSEDDRNRSGQETQFPKVFKGKHMNRTTAFDAPGTIRIEWKTTGPLFQLYVRKSSGGSVSSPVSQSGLSGTTTGAVTVNVEGKIYFKVNSLGNWVIKVNPA